MKTRERITEPGEDTYPGEPEYTMFRVVKGGVDILLGNTCEKRQEAYGRIKKAVEGIFEISNKDTEIRDGEEVLALNSECAISRTVNTPEGANEVSIIKTSIEPSDLRNKKITTKYTTNGKHGRVVVKAQDATADFPGHASRLFPRIEFPAPKNGKPQTLNGSLKYWRYTKPIMKQKKLARRWAKHKCSTPIK